MTDKQRLVLWMKENGYTATTLAHATGDTPSSISQMMTGVREVNQAFKWRFGQAFGFDVAAKVFLVAIPA